MGHILSLIVFLPLLGAVITLFVPGKINGDQKEDVIARPLAVVTSFLTLLLNVLLVFRFEDKNAGLQFAENMQWVSSLNISYSLGVDGLSIISLVSVALIFFIGLLGAFQTYKNHKGFYVSVLLLEFSALGVLVAQDLFLFMVFWMFSLLPAYFLILVWGEGRKIEAASEFFTFQVLGGTMIMLAMISIYYLLDPSTFSIPEMSARLREMQGDSASNFGEKWDQMRLIYVLFAIGFATRVPIVPMHRWLPSVVANSPGWLSGIIVPTFITMGSYGLMRVNFSILPMMSKWVSVTLGVLGVTNILYGAFCAFAQVDLRKLVSYLTLSSAGLVLLGFAYFDVTAMRGAVLQIQVQGLYLAFVIFLVGVIGRKRNTFDLVAPPGIVDGIVGQGSATVFEQLPALLLFFTIGMMSALGLPGFGGFPAQSMIYFGVYPHSRILTILAMIGLLVGVGYMLRIYRTLFIEDSSFKGAKDLTLYEKLVFLPLALAVLWVGIYPDPFLEKTKVTIDLLLNNLGDFLK